MAFWNPGQIISINDGARPNDGTGDDIRDAFIKVNNNFGNISSQLSQFNQDWTNANIEFNLNANFGNISNLFVSNSTGITSNFTGNTSSGNIIANTGLYSSTVTYLTGNTYVSGNIIPTTVGTYNLGTPTRPFGNLYVQNTVSTNQISQSTDAGILKIHANAFVGDSQDTGILGNISSDFPSSGNTYVFFGHQYATNNFIYAFTNNDATKGNNIVVGLTYGNLQFGSGLFSNTTPSSSTTTGALVVAGGVGIGGNLTVGNNINVTSNIYSNGGQVVTTNTPGIGSVYNGTSAIITGNIVYPAATMSTSYSTGAIVLPYGGIGVFGNVTSQSGFVGSLYGVVQSPAQPNITSLGTLTGLSLVNGSTLSASSISATSVGTTNLTVTSSITATGLPITGLSNIGTAVLYVSGNAQVSNVNSSGNIWAGYYLGNGSLLSGIPTVGQLQTLNANVGTIYTHVNTLDANIGAYETWANIQLSGGATQPLSANLGAYQIANNANVGTIYTHVNTLDANVGAYETWANTTFATGSGLQSLNANVGAFETYANIQLNGGSTQGLSANIGAYQIYANANAAIQQTSINSLATGANANTAAYLAASSITIGGNLTIAGNILPVANATVNLGDSTHWFGTFYGTSTHALYADLAENYTADFNYEPGTVLVFGGTAEVTTTTVFADSRVAGAVSTEPAYIMNGGLTGDHVVAIALRGRIPCKVIGPVTKGDLLVASADAGYAVSVGADKTQGVAIFAKSLITDLSNGIKIIEAVII